MKTDVRDAGHLARLLHLNEIVLVMVPSVTQEPRAFWCAREDVGKDLVSARHRIWKLLLRQGSSTTAGRMDGKHEARLRSHRFEASGLQLAYDAAFDTMLAATDRNQRRQA